MIRVLQDLSQVSPEGFAAIWKILTVFGSLVVASFCFHCCVLGVRRNRANRLKRENHDFMSRYRKVCRNIEIVSLNAFFAATCTVPAAHHTSQLLTLLSSSFCAPVIFSLSMLNLVGNRRAQMLRMNVSWAAKKMRGIANA